MKRDNARTFLAIFCFACAAMSTPCALAAESHLTAFEIVQRNATARGGLEAWRNVQSMSMAGLMDAGKVRHDGGNLKSDFRKAASNVRTVRATPRSGKSGTAQVEEPEKIVRLPFTLDLQRPRKMHLELQFQGQTALQVYDGVNGWKVRPFLGRSDVDPYTEEEAKAASQQQQLDGLLIDYAAKQTQVALDGTEQVEGKNTYKLKLTLRDGQVRHVWIDAQTFLEARIDGSRRLDGKQRTVMTYFRDYRQVNGLLIPHVLETRVDGVNDSERIVVERIALNTKFNETHFMKPQQK